jgi:hypothetical protein
MKYTCDFRLILHVWLDNDKVSYEILDSGVWNNDFLFRSKALAKQNKTFVDAKNKLPHLFPLKGNNDYMNPRMFYADEHGNELLTNNIESLIEADIKPAKESYWEVVGKIEDLTYQTYEGDYDSDTEFKDVKVQELDLDDVNAWAKEQGLKLKDLNDKKA